MIKQTKALAKTADDKVLTQLANAYPQEESEKRIQLPRLGMYSQDKTEEIGSGRNKKINVIAAAGEFFIEHQTDETDEDGKKIWEKKEIGDSIQVIIFYKRHQLRMYDEKTEKYTSSPVYDTNNEVIPLFCDKVEVARGTPAELKQKYLTKEKDNRGNFKSALEDNRVLYVLYEKEIYQMNLRGSSMYSLLSYERTVSAPTVVTEITSEAMERGQIAWNKMIFRSVRKLTANEAAKLLELQTNTAEAVAISKASFEQSAEDKKVSDDFDKIGPGPRIPKSF